MESHAPNQHDLQPVASPPRRAAALADLETFCRTYFPHTFHWESTDRHRQFIASMHKAILAGGRFEETLPRGWGTTSLMHAGCIHAVLSGRHAFVFLVSHSSASAAASLRCIKNTLANRSQLTADFPEIVHQAGARMARTRLVLPIVAGSASNGAAIQSAGRYSSMCGVIHTTGDGRRVRPSLVMADVLSGEELNPPSLIPAKGPTDGQQEAR